MTAAAGSIAGAGGCHQKSQHGADQNAGSERRPRIAGDVVVGQSGVVPYLGCGGPALTLQRVLGLRHGGFHPATKLVELGAMFVVQSFEKFFDVIDKRLKLAAGFQDCSRAASKETPESALRGCRKYRRLAVQIA